MSPDHEKPKRQLPSPEERWVPRRKVMVLAALRERATTVEEVCRRYSLSRDELLSWFAAFESHGVPGLRTTQVQHYRRLENAKGGRTVSQNTEHQNSARAAKD